MHHNGPYTPRVGGLQPRIHTRCCRDGRSVLMKFTLSTVLLLSGLALAGCSNPARPDAAASASAVASSSGSGTDMALSSKGGNPPSPDSGMGFNGVVSGFPTGRVFVS